MLNNLMQLPDFQMISNLVLASILGGMIGFLREKEGKVAGLRTHILVAMGSCLAMIVSLQMVDFSPAADPSRIAAGVITGIGFLGAGAIIQAGASVKGITTAATIWGASAIGLATGCSLYSSAIFATILTVFCLQVLREVEHKYIHKQKDE